MMNKVVLLTFRILLPITLGITMLIVPDTAQRKLAGNSEFVDWLLRLWITIMFCYYYWKIPAMHTTRLDKKVMSFWYGANKQPYASRKELVVLYLMGAIVSVVGWSFVLGWALWMFTPFLGKWLLLLLVVVHGGIYFAGVVSRLHAYLSLHEHTASK